MSSIADSMRPEPGEWPEAWVTLEGILEPGTPGVVAAAPAAHPSKAGGLGTRRGHKSRARSNGRRRGQGRMPTRAIALLHRRANAFSILELQCCWKRMPVEVRCPKDSVPEAFPGYKLSHRTCVSRFDRMPAELHFPPCSTYVSPHARMPASDRMPPGLHFPPRRACLSRFDRMPLPARQQVFECHPGGTFFRVIHLCHLLIGCQ